MVFHIQHVGDNSVSAEQMGINVNAVKIKAFMFVGIGSAIGGIFTTMITYTFFPTQGFGYLLLALAAVFVGGTPYWGGFRNYYWSSIWRWYNCLYGNRNHCHWLEWRVETIF